MGQQRSLNVAYRSSLRMTRLYLGLTTAFIKPLRVREAQGYLKDINNVDRKDSLCMLNSPHRKLSTWPPYIDPDLGPVLDIQTVFYRIIAPN